MNGRKWNMQYTFSYKAVIEKNCPFPCKTVTIPFYGAYSAFWSPPPLQKSTSTTGCYPILPFPLGRWLDCKWWEFVVAVSAAWWRGQRSCWVCVRPSSVSLQSVNLQSVSLQSVRLLLLLMQRVSSAADAGAAWARVAWRTHPCQGSLPPALLTGSV